MFGRIALLSLPLVSLALGSVGRAPRLEDISRGMLGRIGLWMLWKDSRGTGHAHSQGYGCRIRSRADPTLADAVLDDISNPARRAEAGVAFAALMMIGVALVLGTVVLAAVLFRHQPFFSHHHLRR